ncbi:MAG: MaoC family dehydratase [Candidatus Limnocylindrales bacterium]
MTASGSRAGIPLQVGAPLATVERVVTQAMIDAYAELSNDRNPLHVDPGFASGTRYGGTIAHGLLSAGLLSVMLERSFPGDWSRGGRLDLRFVGPIKPGQNVATVGQLDVVEPRDDGTRVEGSLGCRLDDGSLAIAGHFSLVIRPDGPGDEAPNEQEMG